MASVTDAASRNSTRPGALPNDIAVRADSRRPRPGPRPGARQDQLPGAGHPGALLTKVTLPPRARSRHNPTATPAPPRTARPCHRSRPGGQASRTTAFGVTSTSVSFPSCCSLRAVRVVLGALHVPSGLRPRRVHRASARRLGGAPWNLPRRAPSPDPKPLAPGVPLDDGHDRLVGDADLIGRACNANLRRPRVSGPDKPLLRLGVLGRAAFAPRARREIRDSTQRGWTSRWVMSSSVRFTELRSVSRWSMGEVD